MPDQSEGTRVFLWLAPEVQNFLHLPAYAVLALCWWWALAGFPLNDRARLVMSWILSVSWGVIEEWYQSGVPGRHGSFGDATMDMAGVSLALLAAVLILKQRVQPIPPGV